jgi:FKBP-type peptidyl-prolyl cis-trans isomerase
MKRIFFILPVLFSVSYAQTKKSPVKPAAKKAVNNAILTATDSLSYAMGVQTAEYYKNKGVVKVNAEMIKKAYDDVYSNKTTIMSPQACDMTIQTKLQQFMTEKVDVEKAEGKKFAEENKKKPGVVTLPDGLQYEILTKGTGPVPTAADTIKANYMGALLDGYEFDNSYKRNEPLEIPVARVIRGWTEALELMPVGSKWKLYIPSDLGYGDAGAGAIPGGATLVFTIELLDIVHTK